MKRLALILLTIMLLTACGSSRPRGSFAIDYSPHVPKSDVTRLGKQRERQAGREAERLLKRFSPPPGASRLPNAAGTDRLAQSGLGVSVVNMTADRFAFWSVPAGAKSVLAFEREHMMRGLQGRGGGSSPDGHASEQFYGPSVDGLPMQREVSVSVEPRGDGSAVRLDVGVSWIYPRSPREVVPKSVREIDIRGGGVSERVNDRAKVARIVRWFDALNASQPGPAVECMVVGGPFVRFAFRSAGGATLATADVHGDATNCNTIAFTIRGKRQWPLIDARMAAYSFASRVQRLLNVRFSGLRR